MQQEKANFSISRMARLLEVSRSGYYAWLNKQQNKVCGGDPKEKYYTDLDTRIRTIWRDSDEVSGAPRITAELHAQGVKINRKTVAKRMRLLGI